MAVLVLKAAQDGSGDFRTVQETIDAVPLQNPSYRDSHRFGNLPAAGVRAQDEELHHARWPGSEAHCAHLKQHRHQDRAPPFLSRPPLV
ncbi:hypothetical protein ACFX15_027584 [Malus domestica]